MKNKKVEAEIEKDIEESTITTEMVAATLLCNSLDMFLRDIDSRIRMIYRSHGMNVKVASDDNILSGMARYSKAVHNALYWFEREVEPRITDATFDSTGLAAYEDFRYSANEICRLIMMVIDRGKHENAMVEIFDFLSSMKAGDRFTEEDFERFFLK